MRPSGLKAVGAGKRLHHFCRFEKQHPHGRGGGTTEFFRLLARLSKVDHPVRHLPVWAGKAMGAVEVTRARLFGHRPQITSGAAEIFEHDWVYSSAKAIRELGYRVTALKEGLRKTLFH